MTKIYILGSVGSGKTSLAKRLAKETNIKHYELDNVIWQYNPGGDIKRTKEEIEKLFSDIINQDNWIIENVGKKEFDKGLEKADTIIYLKISKLVLYKRILLRWIKQNLKIEKTTYKTDFKMLKQMYKWAEKEEKNSKLNELDNYKEKIVILNEKSMKKYIYK